MPYRLLADGLVVVHLAFIVFVIGGGVLALRWRALAWVHIPAACWGAAIEYMGWICPLTPLENRLRIAGDDAGYAGGFVEHYIVPLIYPGELTRMTQFILGSLVVAINVVAYSAYYRRRRADRAIASS